MCSLPPFVHPDVRIEIRSSLFSGLLGPGCDECPIDACDRSVGIGTKGEPIRHDDPGAVVSWPACPHKWDVLWDDGFEVLTPAELCRWAFELGMHRDPNLSAGAESLLREYSRLRDLPGRLLTAKRIEEAREDSRSNS